MGIFLIIPFPALSVWTLIALFRRLRRRDTSRGLWGAFSILAACGIAVGIWCAVYCEYRVGTGFRIGGFPIPAVFFHFEDGQWVDFPVAPPIAMLAVFGNITVLTALATLPVWLLSRRRAACRLDPVVQKHQN